MLNNKQKTYSYIFNQILIRDKLINLIMFQGNKRTSEKIILKLHKNILKSNIKKINVKDLLKSTSINSSPFVNVRSAKKTRKSFQLPYYLMHNSRIKFSYRILISNSKTKYKRSLIDNLINEILKSSTCNIKTFGKSFNIDNKLELYNSAQANKAFAHYRWF
jgi:small subunit ribosomal protein S7